MMDKKLINILKTAILCSFIISCKDDIELPSIKSLEEVVVITNRSSGSLSFIDSKTNQVTKTLEIAGSDPMYVVYVASNDKIYVGDRKTNKILIINPQSKEVESSINVGKGIFHMWANENQLWVNNDIDKTISVINLKTNTVIKTIIINSGFTPHDIFLTKDGTKAFVSVFNPDFGSPDSIFSYSTTTFEKTGEIVVGKEPHLYYLENPNKLYVPCQSGQLYTLNGKDLSIISTNPFEGAHGIFASPDQNSIFISNIMGSQLFSINASTSMINGTPLNTTIPTPHNIVLNKMGDKMFVTHSGTSANIVSTYSVNGTILNNSSNITVGKNPFGLTYYEREIR